MIKKIPTSQLRPGMYVSDFNAGWLKHPFVFNSLLISSDDEVAQVLKAGIRELYIDTDKGLDVGDGAPTEREAQAASAAALSAMAETTRPLPQQPRASLAEEMVRARSAFGDATKIIRNIMEDIRLGNQIDVAQTRPTVERITNSVMRNSSAMITMRRLKSLDDYTFLHSVSVCAMLATFGKVLEMDLQSIHDMALGGLLHDVGKMRVVNAVLNKPARLTGEEYTHIKSHVILGSDLIRQLPGIPALALEPLELHHERHDGSGYPKGLKGDEISRVGKMAAIVDVYDAITSDRVYRRGMSPAAAVQRLFEWSKEGKFDPELSQVFLKSIGIYPIGSLVRLESGRLGVVIEQSEAHLLKPVVKVIFDLRHQHYLTPEIVDLARPLGSGGGDRIVGYELPEKLNIDVARFLP